MSPRRFSPASIPEGSFENILPLLVAGMREGSDLANPKPNAGAAPPPDGGGGKEGAAEQGQVYLSSWPTRLLTSPLVPRSLLLAIAPCCEGRVRDSLEGAGIACNRIGEICLKDEGLTWTRGGAETVLPEFVSDELVKAFTTEP